MSNIIWSRTMPALFRLAPVLLLVVPIAGCATGGQTNRKPTKKVTVIVNYKGAPLEGATITFLPQGADVKECVAYGKTDAQGKAKMKTYVEGDGAVVGTHKVLLDKSESVGGQKVDVDSPQYDPSAPPATVKYHVPQKYGNPATSGLSAEVKESGPNEFTFDVTD
jgi:hypothetical protein